VTTFDSLPIALQGWQNFYILAGTASATLTGLMFVAITFGSTLVTREMAQSTRAFVDPIYMHFVQVLLTSCLLIIPVLGPTLLGSALIFAGALRLVGLHAVLRRYQEAHRKYNDIELSDWLSALVLPFLCHSLLMATGAGFILRQAAALIGLAIVTLALLFIGIHSAWELFVWMALAVSDRRRDPSSPAPPAARPPSERAE
jgi:modulator of FtsH protease